MQIGIFVIIKKLLTYLSRLPSIIVIVIACLTIVQVHLNQVRYKYDNVIQWDVCGYYSYLPATFIDKDLRLNFINPENEIAYSGIKYAYVDDSLGHHILKYPMGMSVLYSPFFFVAHVLAKPLGYPADGFSEIYEFFIEFSGLLYVLLGLCFLRKLVLQFYDEKIATLILAIVFFGTNLLCYSALDAAMSHAYTFSLFSVFLYFTVDFYKKVTIKNTLVLALCFGLIVLVRPFNVFFILPLLLFGVGTFNDLRLRVSLLAKHYKYGLLFFLITGLIILPQLLYYKYVTGHYFVFSYGKEKFYFNNFHLLDVLFSFRKGWFIYTPVMLFAFLGFWKIKNQTIGAFKSSLFILLPIYLYLVSSWWCWWYGGSFSQRSMVDIYPLLALPLAAFLFRLKSFSYVKKTTIYIVIGFCVLLNLFQTIQYKYNIIDYDGMTAREYVQVFGTLNSAKIDNTLLNKPKYERAVRGFEE